MKIAALQKVPDKTYKYADIPCGTVFRVNTDRHSTLYMKAKGYGDIAQPTAGRGHCVTLDSGIIYEISFNDTVFPDFDAVLTPTK